MVDIVPGSHDPGVVFCGTVCACAEVLLCRSIAVRVGYKHVEGVLQHPRPGLGNALVAQLRTDRNGTRVFSRGIVESLLKLEFLVSKAVEIQTGESV